MRVAIRFQAAGRGPEGALAEDREQRREQGEGGGEHHGDADRQDRAEPAGRLEVGDEQDQHRGDDRSAGGQQGRAGLTHGLAKGLGS